MVEIASYLKLIPLPLVIALSVIILLAVGKSKFDQARYQSIVIYSLHTINRARGNEISESDLDRIEHAARINGWGLHGKHVEYLRNTNKFFIFVPESQFDGELATEWAAYLKKSKGKRPSLPIVGLVTCGVDNTLDANGTKLPTGRKFTSKSRDWDDHR